VTVFKQSSNDKKFAIELSRLFGKIVYSV